MVPDSKACYNETENDGCKIVMVVLMVIAIIVVVMVVVLVMVMMIVGLN